MANIPVERDTSKPWWLWLLGILLLALLVWLAFELFDDEPDADEIAGTEDNVGVIDDVDLSDDLAAATDITTEDQLYAVEDTVASEGVTVTRLEPGSAVNLQNVPVLSVIGDSAFWIGRDDARRYLVVLAGLGEDETGAGGSDGVFNVDEGDTVSITGAIARFVEGERGLSGLTDDDTQALRERDAYIRVNSNGDINVMGGAAGGTDEAMMEGAEM